MEIDLESGDLAMEVECYCHYGEKMNKKMEERECRICHLNEEECGGVTNYIELRCNCKGDLSSAHQHCADTWFKIKGNRTCEICGAIALYVSEEEYRNIEVNHCRGGPVGEAATTSERINETPSYNHGRRIMNVLLTFMILAFIISWLFHFHVLP